MGKPRMHWAYTDKRDLIVAKISSKRKENPTRYWLGKKRSAETIRKISERLKGRDSPKYWLGKKLSSKHKQKISLSLKGKIPKNLSLINSPKCMTQRRLDALKQIRIKGNTNPDSMKRKSAGIRRARIREIEEGRRGLLIWNPNYYSSYERTFESFLLSMGLVKDKDFFHNKRIGRYWGDFLILAQHLIFEVDGHQSHYTKEGMKKDSDRDKYLAERGYHVVHLDKKALGNNGVLTKIYDEVVSYT